jgi:hypothetical protein
MPEKSGFPSALRGIADSPHITNFQKDAPLVGLLESIGFDR